MFETILKPENVYCVIPENRRNGYTQYKKVFDVENPISDVKKLVIGLSSTSERTLLINTVSPCSIKDFIVVIIGCFNKKSNLDEVIKKNFSYKIKFNEIIFNFNDIIISVKKGNAHFFDIYFEFKSKAKAEMGRHWKELKWNNGDDSYYWQEARANALAFISFL